MTLARVSPVEIRIDNNVTITLEDFCNLFSEQNCLQNVSQMYNFITNPLMYS